MHVTGTATAAAGQRDLRAAYTSAAASFDRAVAELLPSVPNGRSSYLSPGAPATQAELASHLSAAIEATLAGVSQLQPLVPEVRGSELVRLADVIGASARSAGQLQQLLDSGASPRDAGTRIGTAHESLLDAAAALRR